MIRSSANLESDDVHIRCRVRRSPYASQPDFGEEQEMTCTMRNWQPQRKSSASKFSDVLPVMKSNSNSSKPSDTTLQMIEGDAHNQGPELLLRLVAPSTASSNGSDASNGQFSDRFNSFGSSGSMRAKRKVWAERRQESPLRIPKPQQMGFYLPISDIVVADVHDENVLFLTTLSHGYFEFSFRTANARDMMVAFLTASLSPQRIVSQSSLPSETEWEDRICSFDVETFTASRIEERVRTESLSEKFRRKVAHVALQIGEMSSALSECACGCGTTASPNKEALVDDAERQSPSPPRRVLQPGHMEFSTNSLDEFSTPRKGNHVNLEPELEVARP